MSEAIVLKTQVKIKNFFQGSKAKRDFFAGEELLAYDVGQMIEFERGYATCGLGHEPDGLPPMSVLITCWRRARDSWKRVTEALPQGELRDEMALELQIRDHAMDKLADEAQALLERKGANGHG
jgi:hypothetical protein